MSTRMILVVFNSSPNVYYNITTVLLLHPSHHFPRNLYYHAHFNPHPISPLLKPFTPLQHFPQPPPPPATTTATTTTTTTMLLSVVLALFLPCAGMTVIFIIYISLLCYAARYHTNNHPNDPIKPTTNRGLSSAQLQKLPVTTGKDLTLGNECAVCLDDVEQQQLARIFPGCNHGFHLKCADTWLSKNPVCPVCRNKLDDGFFSCSETNPC
ncbi:hypothetical protein QVD17_29012 [Tagetes erecta]|uniref:RING-type domain-containing protein n=1 Tax=Tagetes erecta TaxID=13708 RepID=A0AAD8KEP0_TARER|nr:hypothetical protein QVD17_29012 [Tagetes erecta]